MLGRLVRTVEWLILCASASPDGEWLASYRGNGLFVMKPDGSELTRIIPDMGGLPGTLTWIP